MEVQPGISTTAVARVISVIEVPAHGYFVDARHMGPDGNANAATVQVNDRCAVLASWCQPNAYRDKPESYGRGWECERGYREVQTKCVAVAVPANGYLTDNCLWLMAGRATGDISKVDNTCTEIAVPTPTGSSRKRHRTDRDGSACEAIMPTDGDCVELKVCRSTRTSTIQATTGPAIRRSRSGKKPALTQLRASGRKGALARKVKGNDGRSQSIWMSTAAWPLRKQRRPADRNCRIFITIRSALRRRQQELEKLLMAAPAQTWPEAAAKAQYLIQLFR